MELDPSVSLKSALLDNLSDTEGILRQLSETLVLAKEKRTTDGAPIDMKQLIQLFEAKQTQFKGFVAKANEFAQRQVLIDDLERELAVRDAYLDKIQGTLKEAEGSLISSIFQANQKLKSIKQASHRRVNPEDLIKYAHQISRTNAVAAPLTWQQGDPERPYPGDVEMRQGWLARPEEPKPPGPGPVETGDLSQRRTQTSPRGGQRLPPPSPHVMTRVGSFPGSPSAMVAPPPPYGARPWPARYPSGFPSPQRPRPNQPYPAPPRAVPSPRQMGAPFPQTRQRRPSGMARVTPTQKKPVQSYASARDEVMSSDSSSSSSSDSPS